MRLVDYVRLGVANVRTRKKRAFLVAMAVGLIFGILLTGSLLVQGIENVVLEKMTKPTGGKVLLEVSTRQTCVQGECEFIDAERVITEVADRFDGEILDSGTVRVGYGSLPTIASEVLESAVEVDLELIPVDVVPVLTALDKLAEWQRYIIPDRTAKAKSRVGAMDELRAKSLGQEIAIGREKLMPVGVLPGAFGVSTLSLAEIGQKTNPLNMILEQIRVGESTAFALNNGGDDEADGGISQGAIFVLLPDIPTALAYRRALDAEACPLSDLQSRGCNPVVEFATKQAVGDSLAASEAFSTIWQVYGWLILGLAAVAGVVMLSTYTRLISDDMDKIALYHSLGASRLQIAGIYYIYLSTLSLLASLFAIVIGIVLTMLVNLLNRQALSQIFALAFGGETQQVFFLGFNLQPLVFLGLMLLFAFVATVLNSYQYGKRKKRA